jgi:hypothetical protein
MATANPIRGAPRIHAELRKLGLEAAERTVSRLLPTRRTQPSQAWRTFLANHLLDLVSIDFFTVPTARFRRAGQVGAGRRWQVEVRAARGQQLNNGLDLAVYGRPGGQAAAPARRAPPATAAVHDGLVIAAPDIGQALQVGQQVRFKVVSVPLCVRPLGEVTSTRADGDVGGARVRVSISAPRWDGDDYVAGKTVTKVW